MDEPIEDPTINEVAFRGLTVFDIIVYSTMLLFASYMIAKYLIYEKRHEITYLPAFYALTVALAILKLCQFITNYSSRMTGESHQVYIMNISSTISSQIYL